MKKIKLKPGEALALKSVSADMTAYNDFVWPKKGKCVAPDWESTQECGAGLHFWLWGEGDAGLRVTAADAKWLVLVVKLDTVIDLGGKAKGPDCDVVFCGERHEAVAIIQEHAPEGNNCIFGTATAGYSGTATAGYSGTATAGYRGTATAGYRGTATAGDSGTATAGDYGTATAGDSGTATAGDRGTATAGYRGTATAGDRGTATAGDRGTATAGDSGTATAGDSGTATAGDSGTATAGDSGTATAGEEGVISILYYDREKEKYSRKIALIDGVNFLPGVKYRLNDAHEFEAVP